MKINAAGPPRHTNTLTEIEASIQQRDVAVQ